MRPDSPAARFLPKVGDVVAGKYRVRRVLGEGGMGVVYEAAHLRLRQRVAVKFLNPALTGQADLVRRFAREARTAFALTGPNVVRTLDVDETPEGVPFIVSEYVKGHDLSKELETRGRIPVGEAIDFVLQACAGVAEAHRAGIIHRDLKPSNLFLARTAKGTELKVFDFGISKVEGVKDELTATGVYLGSPSYASPEQSTAAHLVDRRADVWSLAVILYRLLSNALPFGTRDQVAATIISVATDPPRPLPPDLVIPEGLRSAIWKALEKERDARFPDVESFAAAIAPFGSGRVAPVKKMLSIGTPALPFEVSGDSDPAPVSPAPSAAPGSDVATTVEGRAARTDSSWERSLLRAKQERARRVAVWGGVAALVGLSALVVVAAARRPSNSGTPSVAVAPLAPPTPSLAPSASAAALSLPPVASSSSTAAASPALTAAPAEPTLHRPGTTEKRPSPTHSPSHVHPAQPPAYIE